MSQKVTRQPRTSQACCSVRLHVALTALWIVTLACSTSTSSSEEGDEASFEVNGQAHFFDSPTDDVRASVAGEHFSLHVSRLNGPSLDFNLTGYDGAATYGLGEASPGFARLSVGDLVYETTGPQADGSLIISSAHCSTETWHDPVTGITGPVTTCRVRGTFAFAAVSQTGKWVVVTQGSFSATSIRGQG